MPTNKIDITLTPAQKIAIQKAIDILKSNLPFGVSLTRQERTELSDLKDEHISFVERVIDDHAPVNLNLVNGFGGTLAQAQSDLTLYQELRTYILQLRRVLEMYEDTQQLAGSEAYTFSRVFYHSAMVAAQNHEAGAEAIVTDLDHLYDEQGRKQTI